MIAFATVACCAAAPSASAGDVSARADASVPGPRSINIASAFGGRTRHAVVAEGEGRSFIAVSGQAGASTGSDSFRVWELAPDWTLSPLPSPPPTFARGSNLLLAVVGGRPCLGYLLDRSEGPEFDFSSYIACFQEGEWRELTLPAPRRTDIVWDLRSQRGELYAVTLEEVGSGVDGERIFHVLRYSVDAWSEYPALRFAGRPPRYGPMAQVRLGSSVDGGPAAPVIGVMEGFWRGSRRMVLTFDGVAWRDLVPAATSRSGGPLLSGPIVRGRTVVMPDVESRPWPARFTVLRSRIGGDAPLRFGRREFSRTGYGHADGAVHLVRGRFWASWTEWPNGEDLLRLESRLYVAPLNVSRGRVGKARLIWRGKGGVDGGLVEIRGQVYVLYLVPVRGGVWRPVIRRLDS